MVQFVLNVKTRKITGKQSNKLRKKNIIPAILYGHGIKNQDLQVEYSKFAEVFKNAGASTLIDLVIDNNKPIKVLIYDYQKDPIKDKFLHIDFYQVKMDEEITAEVELNFIGESRAVKELGGTLVKNTDKLEIKCLPADLISKIDVDTSVLNTFNDTIHVKDLLVSEKIKVLANPDEIVATVFAPRTEEELKELDQGVEEKIAEVAGVDEEGKAREEGAEEVKKEEKDNDLIT